MIERPSRNHGERRAGAAIDLLILHYTGMKSAAAALQRLCDPRAQVSAHYLIDEFGLVYRLVPEERRAWHAGVSCWAGERDINSRSIGIELANPGHDHGYRDFPGAQIAALIALARGILGRHPIPPRRVLGHSDVAPGRKIDPGERFPWQKLAAQGIGLWPDVATAVTVETAELQRSLAAFGYDVAPSGTMDVPTRAALSAFQRHFRPARADGIADAETTGLLTALLAPTPTN